MPPEHRSGISPSIHPASSGIRTIVLLVLILLSQAAGRAALARVPHLPAEGGPERELNLEDRITAQEAIERVYYRHLASPGRDFEQTFPRPRLEERVRTYLKQSAALDAYWRTPVTAEALDAELSRITRDTRMPERLGEIFAALDHDLFVIKECFVRSILAGRLVRQFAEGDDRVQNAIEPFGGFAPLESSASSDAARRRAAREVWWSEHAGDFDELEVAPVATSAPAPGARTPAGVECAESAPGDETPESSSIEITAAQGGVFTAMSSPSCLPDDTWRNGALEPNPSARVYHSAVWTGSQVLIWGGTVGTDASHNAVPADGGGRYDPLTDTWSGFSSSGAPAARARHSAIWTGTEMIVWGGIGENGRLDTGGRYDPATDAWSPMSTIGAPSSRHDHTAVWTGSEMIVWGGFAGGGQLASGGRYDPAADSWVPLSSSGAPSARGHHTALWTGTEMLVWGGRTFPDVPSETFLASGGRYDPATDSWAPIAAISGPAPRAAHTAVWTGSEMIIWGGYSRSGGLGGPTTYYGAGGRYSPQSDAWSGMSGLSAPSRRGGHVAAWSGTEMLIWGGFDGFRFVTSSGRYNPSLDHWSIPTTESAPVSRNGAVAAWTGSRFFIWGGYRYGGYFGSGARYDPIADLWTAVSPGPAPAGRINHASVWNGTHLFIWGGGEVLWYLDDGAAYDPMIDAWAPISALSAPTARRSPAAIWTGDYLLIWGGATDEPVWGGARYDPINDVWLPVSLAGAPLPRTGHSVAWSGSRMLVWGGSDAVSGAVLKTGAMYDPVANSWTPMSTAGAPDLPAGHFTFWAGGYMVVWGGLPPPTGSPAAGGRYDPAADRWLTMNLNGAPSGRSGVTIVAAGDSIAVWGGVSTYGVALNTGARYLPQSDSWRGLSAPSGFRGRQSAWVVFAGASIIIWGGRDGSTQLNSGAVYTLADGRWTLMPTLGAPFSRLYGTVLWSGHDLIVWGGRDLNDLSFSNAGARYDPLTNAWRPISVAGAPATRWRHSSVWTGESMIVWGGESPQSSLSSGGLYSSRPAEICDGLDNDCDGEIDDGDPGGGVPCDSRIPGICAAGSTSCQGGGYVCAPDLGPQSEICNYLDDDCDGLDDNPPSGCELTVAAPPEGGAFDCDAVGGPPTVRWDGGRYDRFKLTIATDRAFTRDRLTSGKKWLTAPEWTAPLRKWRRLCAAHTNDLYFKVMGLDVDVPKRDPERKVEGPVVHTGIAR